jgi:hypothetical protein
MLLFLIHSLQVVGKLPLQPPAGLDQQSSDGPSVEGPHLHTFQLLWIGEPSGDRHVIITM